MYATLNLHLQLYKMHRGNTNINVWLQKLSIPPPWKEFFLRSHHLSGNSSQASYIYLTFWAFENPPPPGISNPFCGGSMDVFWIYKIHNYIEILSNPQIQLFVWNRSTVSKTCSKVKRLSMGYSCSQYTAKNMLLMQQTAKKNTS